jgi:hypothetical protein
MFRRRENETTTGAHCAGLIGPPADGMIDEREKDVEICRRRDLIPNQLMAGFAPLVNKTRATHTLPENTFWLSQSKSQTEGLSPR